MEDISVKKVTLKDLQTLQKIARETFSETFGPLNTKENMTKYLEEGFSEIKLGNEISQINSEFFFALKNNEVIGYLKLNTGDSQTEILDTAALEIERIYVLQKFHGSKTGQLLFEKAIEIAKQQRAPYIWLGVWEKNQRAINFYTKNGFSEFDRHLFKLGNDEQTDLMMKLPLNDLA